MLLSVIHCQRTKAQPNILKVVVYVRTKKALKMVGMALLTISVLAICWVFASFVDVTRNNMVPHPEYQSWNFFTLPKEVK